MYTIKPEPYSQGDGIKPVSWSPQGHLFAAEVSAWPYGGTDAFSRWLLVYDADRKHAIEPDLAKLFARKYNRKECAFNFLDVLGFDAQNRVLFAANDTIDPGDEEPLPETRCLGSAGVWALDIDKDRLEFVKHLEPEANQ